MKCWKRLKKEIAIVLAGVMLVIPISAAAEDVFANEGIKPAIEEIAESGETDITEGTVTSEEQTGVGQTAEKIAGTGNETGESQSERKSSDTQIVSADGSLAGQAMKFVNLYWETDDLGELEAVFDGGTDETVVQYLNRQDRGVYETTIPEGDYSRVSFRVSGSEQPLEQSTYNYYGVNVQGEETEVCSFIPEKNNTLYYDMGENPSYWGADPACEETDPDATITIVKEQAQSAMRSTSAAVPGGDGTVKAPETEEVDPEMGNPQPGQMLYAFDLDMVEKYKIEGTADTYRIYIAFMKKGHRDITDLGQLTPDQGEIYTMYERTPGVYSVPFPEKTAEYSEVGFKLLDKTTGEDSPYNEEARHFNFRGETPEENEEEKSKFGYFEYLSGYMDAYYMNTRQDDSYWGAHPSRADQALDTEVMYINVEDSDVEGEKANNNIIADPEDMWISWNGMPQGEGENFDPEKGYKVTSTLPYEWIRYFQFPKNSNATESTVLTLHFKLKALEDAELTEEQKNTEYTYKFTLIPRSERNRLNLDYIWEFNGKMWEHFDAGEGLNTRRIFYDNIRTGYEEVWIRVAREDGIYADKAEIKDWKDWGGSEEELNRVVQEMTDAEGHVTSTWLKMEAVENPAQYDKEDLFQIDIPGDYTKVQFRGILKKDNTEKSYYSNQTAVAKDVAYPSYYAYQSGGPSDTVPETDVETPGINGFWNSVYSVNTAGDESIDIPEEEIQWEEGVYYADSTFYDYYSDWELTGRKITDWNITDWDQMVDASFLGGKEGDPVKMSQIWRQQARNLNTALEGYYKDAVEDEENSNLLAFYMSPDAKLDISLLTDKNLWNHKVETYEQNEWTKKNQGPRYGIVGNRLSDNGNMLLNEKDGSEMKTTDVEHPLFNESFLRGDNKLDIAVGNVYNNVKFPIRVDNEPKSSTYGYWVYNSANASDTLRLSYDVDEGYFMNRTGKGIPFRNKNSFFPFNNLSDFQNPGDNIEKEMSKANFMFATKMEFPFSMTEDGYVYQDKNGDGKFEEDKENPEKNEKLPITFEFQGDDDVWIFIDGILAIDMGGIHDAVRGTVNLTEGTWEVRKGLVSGNTYDGEGTIDKSGKLPEELIDLLADKSKKHTLTMFYMERGLYESNMKLTFNFPRDNRFIVEKEVDVESTRAEGDDIFAGLLENMGSFNFNIMNQATGGETLSVEDSSGHKQPGASTPLFRAGSVDAEFTFKNDDVGSVDVISDGIRRVVQESQVVGDVPEEDTLLKVKPAKSLDVSDKDYLRLSMTNLGVTDRNANNLYLSFVDATGKRVGGYAGTLGYNGESNTFLYGDESIIRVNFKEMTGDAGFDWSKVSYMLIGIRRANPEDIAAYEITYASFYEKMEERPHAGFYVDDTQISDYGSVESGQLEPVDGAWYIRQNKNADGSYDSGVSWNTAGGTFNLADDQRAVFTDRFRTGSYIALKENREPKIFDTEWTLKEGGQEIPAEYLLNTRHDITTVENPLSVIADEWPLSKVSGDVVGDGRKEIVDPEWSAEHPLFTPPMEGNTLVYRSYQNPDNSANIGTDLCVTVKNTLKRGSLTIKKQLTVESADPATGKYKPAEFTFRIYYTDIAGRGLEKQLNPLEETNRYLLQTVTVKTDETGKGELTIPNIPAGTQYHIVEVPANGTRLVGIEIGEPAEIAPHENVHKYDKSGVIVDDSTADYSTAYVQGTAYASNQAVTFTNKIVPFYMDIEKIWKDNLTDKERAIKEVHIQLQRRIQGSETEWTNVTKDYFEEDLADLGKGDYIVLNKENEWKTTSKMALPVEDEDTGERYEYQIVEMNHDNIFQKYEVTYDYVRNEDYNDGTGEKFLHVTYQAINTPAQLQLKKIWKNPEDGEELSRIRVKLLASEKKNGEPEAWVCYKKLTNEHHQCGNSCYIELSSAGDWSSSMRNLPIQKEEGTPYYYKLGEEQIFTDDGWKDVADRSSGYEVTYGEPVTIKDAGDEIPTVTATNKSTLGSIQIVKEDEDKNLLKGAEFKMERLKENPDESDKTKWETDETWQSRSAATNEEGKIVFNKLLHGTYRITETKAPSGYLLSKEGIIITIPYESGDDLIAGSNDVKVQVTDEDDLKHHIILTVKNTKLYELPNAGGSGIYRYMISGVALMIAAMFILYNTNYKRRRRGL